MAYLDPVDSSNILDPCNILGQLILEVTAAASEAEIYAAVAQHLPKLIDCDRASVALLNPEKTEIQILP